MTWKVFRMLLNVASDKTDEKVCWWHLGFWQSHETLFSKKNREDLKLSPAIFRLGRVVKKKKRKTKQMKMKKAK